jgi:quinoprotein glucose dehydrogenase
VAGLRLGPDYPFIFEICLAAAIIRAEKGRTAVTEQLSRRIVRLVPVVCLLFSTPMPLVGQPGAKSGEWRSYGGDLGSTRYAPLDQINASNFNNLEVAWRFKTDNLGPRPEFQYEGTPLMANGVLYVTAGSRRAVVALAPGTGEQLWMHSEQEGARGAAAPRQLSGRGLAYWTDGREERILYVTPGYRLIALNAKTGVPVAGFGNNGAVDLKQDDDQVIDPMNGDIGLHATPMVARNVVIVGAAGKTGANPKSFRNVKGYVRGFDVRTGKRLWIFHTIPELGEFGNDTWEKDSWSYTGNTGAWGQISVDEELGLVYLPVEMPTGDYYGGHRPGAGLFGESLVAVDLQTGKRRWHYQLVHHGIWDMDIPCAPILADISINGRTVKAVAQPTKQGVLYVFDRVTGQPIWPIEERPVPKGDVPGEWYSPTQPFPTKPPPYERTGVTTDDLIDFTPELKAEGLELVKKYKMGPMFTPPVVSRLEGPIALLTRALAGTNWKGGSFDPETHTVYVYSTGAIGSMGLVPPPAGFSDMRYISGNAVSGARLTGGSGSSAGGGRTVAGGAGGAAATAAAAEGGGDVGGGLSVRGLPLGKPPYGSITAIDLDKGEIRWKIAHGETPDNVKNHPALRGLTIPRTGQGGMAATLVTKTLLISGEPRAGVTSTGARGAMLRAYDKATGKDAGAVYMPAPESGAPMTYMFNGKQYIVLAVSGGGYSGELLAFKLPD